MNEAKNFRVVVDLSEFIYDHRRMALIFVRNNMNTVEDLQNRITCIFGIKDFYLATGNNEANHYLPADEDIRVLQKDETVRVLPLKRTEAADSSVHDTTIPIKSPKDLTQKRSLETISEESSEVTSSPKKKKLKKRHKHNKDNASTEEEILIRKKHKIRSNEKQDKVENSESSKTKEALKINKLLPVLQSHIKSCNTSGRSNMADAVRLSHHVDTPIKTFTKYKPPPRNTDQYLAKNKVNIVKIDIVKKGDVEVDVRQNVLPQSSDDANENGRNVPVEMEGCTPPKDFVKSAVEYFEKVISPEEPESSKNQVLCQKINDSEELEEYKGNISAINDSDAIVPDNAQQDGIPSENNTPVSCRSNLREEKLCEAKSRPTSDLLNPPNTPSMTPLDQSPKPTKIPLNMSARFSATPTFSCYFNDISTDSLDSLHQSKIIQYQNENAVKSEALKSIAHIETPLEAIPLPKSELHDPSNTPSLIPLDQNSDLKKPSVNISSIGSMTPTFNDSIRSSNTSQLSSVSPRYSINKTKNEGEESHSESVSIVSAESDCSSQFITKRKRIRKRNKKSKKNTVELLENHVINPVLPRPMNVKACPSIHIKFDDIDNIEEVEEKKCMNDDERISKKEKDVKIKYEEIPMDTVVVNSDTDEDKLLRNGVELDEDYILKAPTMMKLEPKIGDVIGFKILRMTEDYTPQVSSYVVGKVKNYHSKERIVNFEIHQGLDQCLPPNGKLTLDVEENQKNNENDKNREFSWDHLILPRLIYP